MTISEQNAPAVWAPLLVKKIKGRADLDFPRYESEFAAGFDLRASFQDRDMEYTLLAGHTVNIGCGFSFGIPRGYQLEIRPRSGLAIKFGVTILNSPGTIDSDYTGEIVLMLCRPIMNYSYDARLPKEERRNTNFSAPFTIKHGDRIAQAVLTPTIKADIRPADELPSTIRGENGLGSTGIS